MGSITDALKAKGATGSNIAECIETLPSSGGGNDGALVVDIYYSSGYYHASKTYAEILQAYNDKKPVIAITECGVSQSMYLVPSQGGGIGGFCFSVFANAMTTYQGVKQLVLTQYTLNYDESVNKVDVFIKEIDY